MSKKKRIKKITTTVPQPHLQGPGSVADGCDHECYGDCLCQGKPGCSCNMVCQGHCKNKGSYTDVDQVINPIRNK